MTTNYFIPPSAISGETVELPSEEAHHAVRVLRKRPGDEITAVDGEGTWYRIVLEHAEKRYALGRVVDAEHEHGEPTYRLVLGVGLQKQAARLEMILEKGVELGVSRFVPLLTRRSVRDRVNPERARRILIAAMKQSGRSRLPALDPPTPLDRFLHQDDAPLRLLCHERGPSRESLLRTLVGAESPALMFAVGPEGGFDEAELDAARGAGWKLVSLGPRRLRTETAAVAAAALVMASFEASMASFEASADRTHDPG